MTLDPFKAIETSLGINPTATKIAVGGFVVLALALSVAQMATDTSITLWQMLAALVGLMVFMILLGELPLIVRRAGASVVALLFTVWAGCLTVQVVTGNGVPQLASSACIASVGMAERCDVSRGGAEGALVGAVTEPPPPATDDPHEPAFVLPPTNGAGPTEPVEVLPEPPAIPADLRVFIQFAVLPRATVAEIASDLASLGWNVQGAAQGGERLSTASGLNEVRFFHAADEALALRLAEELAHAMAGEVPIEVRDLSRTRFANAAPGRHLEIWISGT